MSAASGVPADDAMPAVADAPVRALGVYTYREVHGLAGLARGGLVDRDRA